MAERDQNEGSGQQPPIGQQQDNQTAGHSGRQSQGQNDSAEQAFDKSDRQQQDLSQGQQSQSQSEQFGQQSGGQSATGQANQGQGGDTATLGTNDDSTGPGGYSDTTGGSDLGGGETGLGDQQGQGQSGGFVGSQGQESGEYLQQGGNPDSGFAEQGRGASNEGNIGSQRSDNDDSDIEGGQ